MWDSQKGDIGPIHKRIRIFTRDFDDDEYFHEIDHAATSDLSNMPDFDTEDAFEIETIDRRYKEGYKIFSGIEESGQKPSGPSFSIGKNENEGITVLKQRDYSKLRGIRYKENGYETQYKIAEQFGCIMGRENLIKKHFYNDIDGIRQEMAKYGIDYDQMLQLSTQFMNTDEMSIDFYDRIVNYNDRRQYEEDCKQEYQDMMSRGFIAKRCQELGIMKASDYYNKLSRRQKKLELKKIEELEQFKIADSQELQSIKKLLQPKRFLQKMKELFLKDTKMLPEAENKHNEETYEVKPWNLSNWGIDVDVFRRGTAEISQNNLQTEENETQNEAIPRDSDDIVEQ